MVQNSYIAVPENDISEFEHRRKIAKTVNGLLQGKMNAVTTLTLAASVASTTLTDARITPQSFIGMMPLTANATAELGNGTLYFPAATQTTGSVVITHANNAQTDRTFTLLIIG